MLHFFSLALPNIEPQGQGGEEEKKEATADWEFTYFAVSVIGGSFIKFLSKFKADFCVFESALCPDHYFVPLAADNHSGFCHIPHLPCCKTHS